MMKALKIVLGVVGLIILIILGIGLFNKQVRYQVSVPINASPDTCWAIMLDTSRMNHWMDGFRHQALISGQPLQPGAVYELLLVQDEEYLMQLQLMQVEPPSRISWLLSNDVLTSRHTYELSPTPSGTTMLVSYTITGRNVLWRSMLTMSAGYLKRNAEKSLLQLKTEIETGDVEFD